jgi:hypothetical protein
VNEGGYRDALSTAKERIARLESDARERGLSLQRPKTETSKHAFTLAVIGTGVFVLAITMRAVFHAWAPDPAQQEVVVTTIPAPVESVPQKKGMVWLEPAWSESSVSGPQLVKLDRVDTYLIAMFWRRGESSNGLHVVALDSWTMKPIWDHGPIEGSWTGSASSRVHLLVVDEKVIVADAIGKAYVLDARSGKEVLHSTFPRGNGSLCLSAEEAPRVLVGENLAFDPETGATKTVKAHCAPPGVCSSAYSDLCHELPSPRPPAPTDHSFKSIDVWRSDEHHVAFDQEHPNHIVGWLTGGTGQWELALEPAEEQPVPIRPPRFAIEKDRAFSLYVRDHEHHLVSVDLQSGKIQYDVPIPEYPLSSKLGYFGFLDQRLFLQVDDSMLAFNAWSGRFVRSVEGE